MVTDSSINGNTVNYESEDQYISYGVDYLKKVNSDEAKVFFDHAYDKSEAPFMDDRGYHFTLLYKDGNYTLISKN